MIKSNKIILCAASVIFGCTMFFAGCKSTPEEETTVEQEEVQKETEEVSVPDNSVAQANEEMYARVQEARAAAVNAGANRHFKELMDALDSDLAMHKKHMDEGSMENQSAAFSDLIKRYEALELLSRAYEKRQTIEDNNWMSYDQKSYDAANALVAEISKGDKLASLNGKKSYEKAQQIDASYEKVLKAAYSDLASKERVNAFNAKKKADEVKAFVARKDDYSDAVNSYKNGEIKRSASPKEAYESYKKATDSFNKLYEEIFKARQEAQKKIDEAKKRVEESKKNAEALDAEAPLGDGESVEIVEDGEQLLEEDNFEKIGAEVIEVPEGAELSADAE